jgi:DNA-binding CsgD family transcriptional regulator
VKLAWHAILIVAPKLATGGALVLSVRTVERHINGIYSKLAVHGRSAATAFAFQLTPA